MSEAVEAWGWRHLYGYTSERRWGDGYDVVGGDGGADRAVVSTEVVAAGKDGGKSFYVVETRIFGGPYGGRVWETVVESGGRCAAETTHREAVALAKRGAALEAKE